MEIADKDFCAVFHGKVWTVEWCWRDNGAPVLKNKISCYDKQLSGHKKEEFDKEVQRWIAEGILIPWHEPVDVGVIPLMAVEQPTKKKVRPVLDFREVNQYVTQVTISRLIVVIRYVIGGRWARLEQLWI